MNEQKALATYPLKIGGVKYKIIFGMLAFARLTEIYKMNSFSAEFMQKMLEPSPVDLYRLIWAGLYYHHELSYSEVERLFNDLNNLEKVSETVGAAFNASVVSLSGEEKKTKLKKPRKKKASK